MAASLDGALDLTPDAVRRVCLLIEKPPAPTPDPPLTEPQIIEWAIAHKSRTDEWPNQKSGAVVEACNEKWENIDIYLGVGARGLPGGTSLARLLASKLGVGKRVNGSDRRVGITKP